ncbi:MAG: 50S ribosomal protein L31 [Legionellales bacterium]|nr:MAG: 50S ribosomal protein L31 [Legionellales bacterium]
MQANIHPDYAEQEFKCSCGNVVTVGTTMDKGMNLDVCSACHPFYTGKQKLVDTAGRVDRFNKRFSGYTAATTDKK